MKYANIVSSGSYLPAKIVTNAEIAAKLDTSDEWITQRTGIKQRYIVSDGENIITMGAQAARLAINTAGLQPKDIDMIIVATCTADQVFPSAACMLQAELDIPNCAAFDIQAACSGFIYGLSVATQFIACQQVKCVLLVGTEAMSKVVNWQDRYFHPQVLFQQFASGIDLFGGGFVFGLCHYYR